MQNKLVNLFKQSKPWLLWFLPYSLIILVNSNKTYVLFFLLFLFCLFFLLNYDLNKTFFYALLLSLPFERVLRSWQYTVVPFSTNFWDPGYEFNFGISLKLIFAFTLFCLLIFKKKKECFKNVLSKKPFLYLFLFLIFALISTLATDRFDIAITGLIRLWFISAIFMFCVIFINETDKKEEILYYFVGVAFIFGLIGTLQFFKKQPLGLYLENFSEIFPLGFETTDGEAIYRVSSLLGHPTYIGSYLSLILPVILGIFFKAVKTNSRPLLKYLSLISIILSTVTIVGTFSRSAWFSVTYIFIAFLVYLKDTLHIKKNIAQNKFISISAAIFIFFLVSNSLIISRIETIQNVWTSGTGRGRLELIRQSFSMTATHPLTGVGLNNFTQSVLEQGIDREYRGFLYPVHNTFLLFFAETGLISGAMFVIFVVTVLVKSWPKAKLDVLSFSVWIGASTFLISAQFHTLFFFDPTLDTFMLMLGWLVIL